MRSYKYALMRVIPMVSLRITPLIATLESQSGPQTLNPCRTHNCPTYNYVVRAEVWWFVHDSIRMQGADQRLSASAYYRYGLIDISILHNIYIYTHIQIFITRDVIGYWYMCYR